MARALSACGLALLLALSGGCATEVVNPATGERQRTLLSPQEEVRIGREQHPQILEEFGGVYENGRVQAYVDRIGQGLARVSETPELPFTFTVLNSDIVNAFALPGGYVYVSRGLLALADNEAELAGVLAHEIGHVTARHAAQRYTRSVYAQLGVAGAAILGGILGGGTVAEGVAQLGGLGAAAWIQGYSREQEFEADQLGVRYLARADYEPRAMATFLEAMRGHDRLQRLIATGDGGEQLPSWLASHPRTADRVVRAAVEAEQAFGGSRIGRDDFLGAIDGMIYGDDPREGVIRGRRFLHPDLRLAFEVPRGWRLSNHPDRVEGRGPAGRAMIFDGARVDPRMPMDVYLSQVWAREIPVHNLERVSVNGMEAAAGRARVQIDGRPGEADLIAIRHGGERVYRFLLVSVGGIGPDAFAEFRHIVGSFRDLGPAEAAAIRPLRLRIVEVRPGETVDDLARRMALDSFALETFLTLNGLAPGARLQPGQRVKLVVEG